MLRCRVWVIAGLLSSIHFAFAQCYDLRSTRLYDPQSHFEEWWDKPIWSAQPGEGNFHVEENSWGRPMQFALFTVGIVKKTPQGWIPLRAHHLSPDIWCDPTPERSGIICYQPPYQIVPPTATIHIKVPSDVEEWSVSANGVVRYHRGRNGAATLIENASAYKMIPGELAGYGRSSTLALLDLNTGVYEFNEDGYGEGNYVRRYPGVGVKLWRKDEFHAKAKLVEVPCPASLEHLAFTKKKPPVTKLQPPPLCAVKFIKGKDGNEVAINAVWHWQFVQNPQKIALPKGCMEVFETPALPEPPPVIVAGDSNSSGLVATPVK